MRGRITGLLIAAAPMLLAANPDELTRTLTGVRGALVRDCHLANWQVGLTADGEGRTRVELTPTASADQVQCTYQVLSDYGVELDRPAPVQVTRRSVKKPDVIY